MTPKLVIHVVTRLDWGGSAQIVLETVLRQNRLQYVPMVVAGTSYGRDDQGGESATRELCHKLDDAGVRWRLVPSLVRDVYPIKDVAALWNLWRLFRRERPAIVHTHTSKAGVLGRLAASLAGVPVVVHTSHGHVFYGHFGRCFSWVAVQIERFLARWTTRTIALTDAEREDYRTRSIGSPDRVAVIPSSVELERFRAHRISKERGTAKKVPEGFDCPSDAVVVGSIGWLTPIKGHRYFIEALAMLKPCHPKLYGVIVGSGELREDLERLAASLGILGSLRLLGKRDDVPECLAVMDLFVLPSLNEGMGRALVEAMASERPVVATRVGGVPAIVEDRVSGLLVPPGDARALASAIDELLCRPNWARELGMTAASRVGDRFSASSMVSAIDTLYEETLREVGAW